MVAGLTLVVPRGQKRKIEPGATVDLSAGATVDLDPASY
jgi:hypothetical protein